MNPQPLRRRAESLSSWMRAAAPRLTAILWHVCCYSTAEGLRRDYMRLIIQVVIIVMSCTGVAGPTLAAGNKGSLKEGITRSEPAVLWRNPANLAARDLYYGPGGRQHAPGGKFTFVKEDLEGSNPKYVVKDEDGVKWKVKLGDEAQPETVATRFVWAMGYFADEDY